jgi:hypothetical protein
MNLNDLANLGQIIGAVAVVVSLIYVAYQIRQNTNAVRAATAQSVHEHFASWYHLLASDESLSQVVIDGLKDYGRRRKRIRHASSRLSWRTFLTRRTLF